MLATRTGSNQARRFLHHPSPATIIPRPSRLSRADGIAPGAPATSLEPTSEWKRLYEKQGDWTTIFTLEFQEALVRDDSRPIAFAGQLQDVLRNEQKGATPGGW